MQDATAAYKRGLRQAQKALVFLVEFEGVPTRYSNFIVMEPLGPYRQLLKEVKGGSGQITIDEGACAAGAFSFSILDRFQEITKLQSRYTLPNRKVTIKSGFRALPESQYTTVFQGKIYTYALDNDNVTWTFQTTSFIRDTKQQVFAAATKLVGPIGAGDATINVVATDGFQPATGLTSPQCFLRIGDEAISYTGVTATSFTGCVRGQLGSVAAAHADGDEAKNLVVFQDNAVNIALQLLTSTGTGTNGPYDVLPFTSGLAVPTGLGTFMPGKQFIDVARFEKQRDQWLGGMTFRFEESDAVEGKQFLEQQIYTFINSYPYVDNLGRLALKTYTPPLPTVDLAFLTDDNLEGAPTWQGNLFERYFFNEVDLSFDFDWLTGKFIDRELAEDATSQSKFGLVSTRTMESRGLRTAVIGQAKIDVIVNRFLRRFSNPTPVIKARVFFSQSLVEVADVVALTTAHLPNTRNGRLGVSAVPMEVIERNPDFVRGSVDLMLLSTGEAYLRKYKAITPRSTLAQNGPPGSFPVFSAATPAQRLYGFIGRRVVPGVDVIGANIPVTPGEKVYMNDGTEGYYIPG